MSYLFPDNNTTKLSTSTLDMLKSIAQSTADKRLERIAALQLEVSILLDTAAGLIDDERSYQQRLGILPELASQEGTFVEGTEVPSILMTLPILSRGNRSSALASIVNDNPFSDLAGSNNIIVKDPQLVLAYNHLMHMLAPIYKHIKIHEHRIRNTCLTLQRKLHLINELQSEQSRIQGI